MARLPHLNAAAALICPAALACAAAVAIVAVPPAAVAGQGVAAVPAAAAGPGVAAVPAAAAAGPGAQKNTADCYGKTRLAGGRAIDFVAHCKPSEELALATLAFTGIASNAPIRWVRRSASFDGDPAGTSCRRGGRSREGRRRITCTSAAGPGLEEPVGHTVRGRFKLKSKRDRCELVAVFGWSGGACVAYDPVSGACADVGLIAGRRFGPPIGC